MRPPNCPLEVSIGDLQMMVLCYGSSIAEPRAHDVTAETFAKFGLSSGSQVVEESRPMALHLIA
jgi:hypothetical protein